MLKPKLRNVVVAGVDIDLGKGAAVVICRGDKLRRHVFFPNIKGISTKRIKYITDKVIRYLKSEAQPKLRPHYVAVEVEAIQARGRYKTDKSRLIGHFLTRLYEEDFGVVEYAPMSVKAFACKGNATKEEVVNAVYEVWGYKFLDKKGLPHFDLSDAFVISQLGLNHIGYLLLDAYMTYLTDKQIQTIKNAIANSPIYSRNELSEIMLK